MLLIWLLGCGVSSEPPASVEPSVLEPLPLAEALYAVDRPSPEVERVQLLLWLRSLELDATQRVALKQAGERVRASLAQRDQALEELEIGQAEAQAEPLQDLERRLAEGRELPQTVDLPRLDPRPIEAAYVTAALDEADAFVAALTPEQVPAMANALFLLRPRLSVGDLEGLLGRPWATGDFATMRRASSEGQDPLDVGGLFLLEGEVLTAELDRERVVVLTALALEHPQLGAALELLPR